MTFSISALPVFEEEVELPRYRHGKITVEYKYVPPAELQAVLESHREHKSVDVLGELITGWKGLKDDGGADVPYNREALESLLNALYCGEQLYSVWLQGLRGARTKN